MTQVKTRVEFRLANYRDLTTENCNKIMEMADSFRKSNQKDSYTCWDVLEIFLHCTRKSSKEVQFWLALKETKIVGYIITEVYAEQNKPALYIRQGYIDEKHRNDGVYEESMDQLSKASKACGFKYITCKSFYNKDLFARFLKKCGYTYHASEFIKEL